MLDERLYTTAHHIRILNADIRNYDPAKPRIKDLLWEHYDWLVEMDRLGKARHCILDNIQRTLLCNTLYLGYDAFECPNCGNGNIIYRHCHSRFCNSCGVKSQKILAAKAESMCLDVPHRHIVFTIPKEYRVFFRKDRSSLNLLFVAARNTICKMFNEPIYRKEKNKQRKTGKIRNDKDNYYLYRNFSKQKDFGMISTLHTFGRDLKWNPHIHALIPELVYDPVSKTAKNVNYFNFKNLRVTWQYEINRLLLQHFGSSFRRIMNTSYSDYNNGFYVYAKKRKQHADSSYSENVGGCVNYMMRYASRPAMAESRIVSYDKKTDSVHWYYDDHKTEERIDVHESGLELLKKMIIHIPDDHFRMVRYYGFYNNKEQELLNLLHEILNEKNKIHKDSADRKDALKSKLNKFRFRTMCIDSYNRDVLKCKCGSIMLYVDTYNPLKGKSNDRNYRKNCINEMREMHLRRGSPGIRS